MKRIIAIALVLLPTAAAAQPAGSPQSLPLVVDLKKAVVGSWAEYGMSFGEIKMKSRWALVARDASSTTLEMSMQGGPTAKMGGKLTLKMVLDPDPIGAAKPVKQIVMQIGDGDPMQAPPEAPTQKFQKPDAKTMIGKETIKVQAGTFPTTHYRDHSPAGTVDVWVSEEVPPLGLVKVVTTPEPEADGAKNPPIPPATMELAATGTGAKPTITKPAKPFDPKGMMGSAPPAGTSKKRK
jgi:hypothetical protein